MGSLLSVYSSLRRERDVCPIAYVTSAVFVESCTDNSAVSAQTQRVVQTGAERSVSPHSGEREHGCLSFRFKNLLFRKGDFSPGADVTLSVLVFTCGDHRTVSLQTYGMIVSCADRSDIRPFVDLALV